MVIENDQIEDQHDQNENTTNVTKHITGMRLLLAAISSLFSILIKNNSKKKYTYILYYENLFQKINIQTSEIMTKFIY